MWIPWILLWPLSNGGLIRLRILVDLGAVRLVVSVNSEGLFLPPRKDAGRIVVYRRWLGIVLLRTDPLYGFLFFFFIVDGFFIAY